MSITVIYVSCFITPVLSQDSPRWRCLWHCNAAEWEDQQFILSLEWLLFVSGPLHSEESMKGMIAFFFMEACSAFQWLRFPAFLMFFSLCSEGSYLLSGVWILPFKRWSTDNFLAFCTECWSLFLWYFSGPFASAVHVSKAFNNQAQVVLLLYDSCPSLSNFSKYLFCSFYCACVHFPPKPIPYLPSLPLFFHLLIILICLLVLFILAVITLSLIF